MTIEDKDILQAAATIIGGLLIFFIFSLSVSLEQKIYGLNFMFGISALALFPFANSIRYCLSEKSKQGRLWFKWGVFGVIVYLAFMFIASALR
jgi:hypothetical protein